MDFKPTVCIYHADCMDGFTAAYQIWRRYSYRDSIRFVAAKHGEKPPYSQVTDADDVIIVDFSYPQKELIELARRSRRVLVLDHHKSAQEALGTLPTVVTPTAATLHQDFEIIGQMAEGAPANLLVCFDMERSGAMMTWDFCWPNIKPTQLVEHVQDRDLWRFKLGDTKGVHLYLTTCPRTFQQWELSEGLLEDPNNSIYEAGEHLLDYHNQVVQHIVNVTGKVSRFFEYDNVAIAAAPPLFASDVGHELLNRYPGADFAAIMCIGADAVNWSLRSEDHRHDVSRVAGMFGGGGHRNAAGFRADG